MILKLTLEAGGRFQVSQADTGTEGVSAARTLLPDAILLDFSLPDMNGTDVLGLLKADTATARIPVIMLTATTTPEDIAACKAQGAVDTMTKPFNPRMLPGQIESILSKHRAGG
jgi:DNA-binding response OmpR family regulator